MRKAKNDNNKEHASMACQEASVILIDPKVSLDFVTEEAVSTLPSGSEPYRVNRGDIKALVTALQRADYEELKQCQAKQSLQSKALAYWESPLSHVGERNTKKDKNKVHCGFPFRVVMSHELYEWQVAYWEESPAYNAGERKAKNDNNEEHASMACQEVSVRKAKNDNNKEHVSMAC